MTNLRQCAMCKRHTTNITFHHLIPKTLHTKKWYTKRYTKSSLEEGIEICEDCHMAIHQFINEKELGKRYNSIELLIEHDKLQKFITWVAKQKSTNFKSQKIKLK